MDYKEYSEVINKCFKIKERLEESVNVCYNELSSILVFWNKYQIFLHDESNIEETSNSFVPEFKINQVVVANDYLVCLDYSGNVHITSLNFKNSAPKKFKSGFQPRANGIICLTQYSQNTVLSLKSDSDSFSLCLHKINAYFQIEKESVLKLKDSRPLPQTTQDKCLMYSQPLSDTDFEALKEMFRDQGILRNDSSIVLLSFDKIHVYACLYNPKTIDEELELVRVYSGSSEICDIIFGADQTLLVGLKCGTVCRQPLKIIEEAQVVHLNTALHKVLAFKEKTLLYTDGISLWTSEETFSKTNINFEKLIVKQPKDFVQVRDRIICTTYTNMIYIFSIDNRNAYENQAKLDEYCSAERLLKNSEYLHKIMKEIEKNDGLIKKVNDERNHITALSLSKRPDIIDKVIQTDVVVYETYEEVITENSDVTLSEHLHNYFEPDSFLFLIKITANLMQQTLNEVLSNLLAEAKIHISLSNESKLLKTTSIKLTEPLKKNHFLVPLHGKEIIGTEVKVNVKLVLNLPGCMDAEQNVWIVLYAKDIILYSEQMIKTPKNLKVNVLKESQEKIEGLILRNMCHYHGNLFDITEVPKPDANEWCFYVKLPTNFKDILKKEDYYKNRFSHAKEVFLHTNLSSEQFLKSKHKFIFDVGPEKVNLEIINDDFCSPMLKITSRDARISFNIRNFLASVVYNDFKECSCQKENVNCTLYTTTENLQKAVKQSLARGSQDELQSLVEQFQKNVIGAFPI